MPLRKNTLIDANVILRFILNDNPEMAKRAAEVIESGAYTKPEIIAEVIYVLKGVYSAPKDKIKSVINKLSEIVRIENEDCVIYAVDLFSTTSLDFVDCLLVAYHSLNNETVFTFDKKLNKYLKDKEDIPLPDEIEAIKRADKSISESGTVSHESINWD